MLVASQLIQGIKDFTKDVTMSFLSYDEDTKSLESASKYIGSVEIGVVAAVFLLMSGLAHAFVLRNWTWYLKALDAETNPARWVEYAVSSSLMIVAIAMLFGCYDLASLILIATSNASMNFFGFLMELLNPPAARARGAVNWAPFAMGCLAGAAPWAVVGLYFFGGGNYDRIPDFVYAILAGYFVFFNTFPVNMVLQYAQCGPWADYRFGEAGYIVLSLLSKSLLAWLVFGGTAQPNGDDDKDY